MPELQVPLLPLSSFYFSFIFLFFYFFFLFKSTLEEIQVNKKRE